MNHTFEQLKSLVQLPFGDDLQKSHVFAKHLPPQIYNDESLKRLWQLSPFTNNYYSKANTIHTGLLKNLSKKDLKYPLWTLRDGAVDLLEFFIDNPARLIEKQWIAIPAQLETIVPEYVREQTLLYEIESHHQSSHPRDTFIASIALSRALTTLEFLETRLLKIKVFCKKRKCSTKFHIYLRDNAFFAEDFRDRSLIFDALAIIHRHFGAEIEVLDEKELNAYSNLNHCYYDFLFDSDAVIGDNWLEHEFLAKGAVPYEQKEDHRKSTFKIPLSIHHSFRYSKPTAAFGKQYDSLVAEMNKLKKLSHSSSKPEHKYASSLLTYGEFFHYLRQIVKR